MTSAEVWEYGFSKVLWLLCPEDWKKPLGDDWEDVLAIITLKWSPESYISRERKIKREEDFHYQFAEQMGSLSRRIYKSQGVDIDELRKLATIYMVCMDKEVIISKIKDEQKAMLDRLGVDLKMC